MSTVMSIGRDSREDIRSGGFRRDFLQEDYNRKLTLLLYYARDDEMEWNWHGWKPGDCFGRPFIWLLRTAFLRCQV